jgi:CarD family transcriptional regulator
VAAKSRHRLKKASAGASRRKKSSVSVVRESKKKSAGDSRRTPQAARGNPRGVAPVAKSAVRKAAGEGAIPGMTSKKTTQRQGFKTSEFIVYPAHGVGQIVAIEEQEVAGAKLELFVINFIKDKMTLRVPTAKIVSVGMRKLAEGPMVKRALETLKGRARIKRTMWSRRAQEYEAKINSGDIVAIAEVVRDLYRSESQPEQSYSERQLYEAALDRLSREIAAVHRVTETEAVKEIEAALAKGPRRGPKPTAEDEDTSIEDEAA